MIRPTFVALFACLCLAAPHVRAQSQPDTLRLVLRLLAFDSSTPLPATIYLHDMAAGDEVPGTAVQVKNYLNHELSQAVVHGREIVFTTGAERASTGRPETRIAKWTMPERKREWLLLFLPSRNNGSVAWQVLGLDDSARGFPPGSFQILNLSRHPVRIRLEKTDYDFKSGQTRLIKDPPVGDNQHSTMTAFCFRDNEWRRIGAGLWPHPGSKRVVEVLYDDPASGQVQLRGFRDVAVRDNLPAEPR